MTQFEREAQSIKKCIPEIISQDSPPITINLNTQVSCHLYRDNRPHCLETSPLHKGLVVAFEGKEVIEEGMGFGVPVVIYKDEPYFSSTAKISTLHEKKSDALMKSFLIDTVSRKKIGRTGYVNKGVYSRFHRLFQNFYLRKTFLTPAFNKIIELMKLFGVNTDFVKVQPRGIINVKYTCRSDSINIEASFSQLNKYRCEEIILLNEQGANFFRKYVDSEGTALLDGKIGAWTPINADEASLSNLSETFAFSLEKSSNAIYFRGREKIRNRYSWVGLSYSIRPASSHFRYIIKLKRS